jgi:hypothetical protein
LDGSLPKICPVIPTSNQDGYQAKNRMVAILVGSRDHRTQIWKGVIQGSFHQSLVEIGSVVSEEKILLKFHPSFFLFLAWWPSWLEVGITGHLFGREPSNDYFIKILFLLSNELLPILTDYAN